MIVFSADEVRRETLALVIVTHFVDKLAWVKMGRETGEEKRRNVKGRKGKGEKMKVRVPLVLLATRLISSSSLAMTRPQMIVFDLDDCLWSPEMYTLPMCPTEPVREGELVIGVRCGSRGPTVKLFPEARVVLERIANGEFPDVMFGLASSSEEPSYSKSCLKNLEIKPGVTMESLFPFTAIGRTDGLTSRKTTHMARLKEQCPELDFKKCLFFDDCGWGDHVGDLNKALGVKGVRTPYGMTVEAFEEGLKMFAT